MNVGYNNGFPHFCGSSFSHCHAAGVASALDQRDQVQRCVTALEGHVASASSYQKDKLKAELEADKELLKKVDGGLYQIEIAKRTSDPTIGKIEGIVKTAVSQAMNQHTNALQGQISQIVKQEVHKAMENFLPEVKQLVAAEVAKGVLEALLSTKTESLELSE